MEGTCGKSCEGIYADVDTVDEKIVNSNFDTMITKYKEYKKYYVKNIGFNSSNYNTNFGELITFQVKSFKFLSDPNPIIVYACHSLPNSLTH